MSSIDRIGGLPDRVGGIAAAPGGADWLASLPRLLDECVEHWSLDLGRAFPDSYVSLVVPAGLPGGEQVVLKIQYPHRESDTEADALAQWDGDGAVRLIDHDPRRHALLIERCVPGTHLSESSGDTLAVFVGLLPRLMVPATEPYTPLEDEARWWADDLIAHWDRAGKPFERKMADAAVDTLRALAGSQVEQVLLHQDLHADNVLSAEREPWLAIDPKPLSGERAFACSPIIRSYELGHSRRDVVYRLDRLSDELGLDRERVRGWTFGQTVAWAFDNDETIARHTETARWLMEA